MAPSTFSEAAPASTVTAATAAAARLEAEDYYFSREARAACKSMEHTESTLGWPVRPEGPACELLQRLKDGYVLTEPQMQRLLEERATAARERGDWRDRERLRGTGRERNGR